MSAAALPARAEVRGGSWNVAGLWTMVRFTLRRNRIFLALWILLLAAMMPATVQKYGDLVPPDQRSGPFLQVLGANPTMRFIVGFPYELGSAGPFTMWRVGTFTAAAAAMMTSLLVIRCTRAEEEEGRQELLRSGRVGRHTPLAAAVVVGLGSMLVLALLIALLLVKSGAAGAGALGVGLGIGLTGAMFVGIAAVFAQVFEVSRSARAWTLGAVLGGLYVLRGIVDAQGDGTVAPAAMWAMPLDWANLVHPYAGDRWWVLLLPAAVTAVTVALAFVLEGHRDHGAGLRRARPGRAGAPASLSGAFGLAWRLQRGGVIGWVGGLVAFILMVSALGLQIDTFASGTTQVAEMFRRLGGNAKSLTDSFYAAMMGLIVVLVALAAVLILGRLRSEEVKGRAEAMLATATSRSRLAWSHLWLALLIGVGLQLLVGGLTPTALAIKNGDWGPVGTMLKAAAMLAPGTLLVIGLGMALIGWAPHLFGLTWAVLAWTFLDAWLVPSVLPVGMDVPQWLTRLTPWGWLPKLPADPVHWVAFGVELALALLLLAVGLIGYRRRDVQAG